MAEVAELRRGELRLFGGAAVPAGLPPAWARNALTGEPAPTKAEIKPETKPEVKPKPEPKPEPKPVTPIEPRPEDKLRAEEIAKDRLTEHIHRIDRLLVQLRLAGVLRQANGIVLGEFTGATAAVPARPSHTLAQTLESALAGLGIPRINGFPYGHIPRKATLPIGLRARLDADRGSLGFLESAVVR
jgi:hypothetical protein